MRDAVCVCAKLIVNTAIDCAEPIFLDMKTNVKYAIICPFRTQMRRYERIEESIYKLTVSDVCVFSLSFSSRRLCHSWVIVYT